MTIAVDFDGTLCDDISPEIGEPHDKLINQLIKFKQNPENKLILWTCRVEEELRSAVEWCNSRGLYFDCINDSTIEHKALYEIDARKVFADLYIDDRCVYWEDWCADDYK